VIPFCSPQPQRPIYTIDFTNLIHVPYSGHIKPTNVSLHTNSSTTVIIFTMYRFKYFRMGKNGSINNSTTSIRSSHHHIKASIAYVQNVQTDIIQTKVTDLFGENESPRGKKKRQKKKRTVQGIFVIMVHYTLT